MNLSEQGNAFNPDELYEMLLELQSRSGSEHWPLVSAKLLLILASRVEDKETLKRVFDMASLDDTSVDPSIEARI